jgi:hypothetical protein
MHALMWINLKSVHCVGKRSPEQEAMLCGAIYRKSPNWQIHRIEGIGSDC